MAKLIWHGHSCYKIEGADYSVVIDAFADGTRGYAPLKLQANASISSHRHGDHYNPAATEIIPGGKPFAIREVKSFHDDEQGAKRGENIIFCIDADGKTVCHLGDLGHLLSAEQVKAIGEVDVLCVPVGGFYTIDAAGAWETVRAIAPKAVVPMHFNLSGDEKAPTATVAPFLAAMPEGMKQVELGDFVLDLDNLQEGAVYTGKPL